MTREGEACKVVYGIDKSLGVEKYMRLKSVTLRTSDTFVRTLWFISILSLVDNWYGLK